MPTKSSVGQLVVIQLSTPEPEPEQPSPCKALPSFPHPLLAAAYLYRARQLSIMSVFLRMH